MDMSISVYRVCKHYIGCNIKNTGFFGFSEKNIFVQRSSFILTIKIHNQTVDDIASKKCMFDEGPCLQRTKTAR